MAFSSTKDFWIHPNALTITLNYFGDQQLIQTSMLAGAVIMAYNKDYIGYNAAHDFREWKLQAYPTQLSDTCEYFVHAVLSRDGDSAMVVYSPTKRGINGETYNAKGELIDSTQSTDSWYIYLGTISASVDADGATVDRVWTDGLHTGTLATDQYRMEEAQGDWALMFKLVNDSIQVLKTITSATINALTVATNFIFGGKTFTGTAGTEDAGKVNKRNDATLPTTGYVSKEIESLDEHFLIKDGTEAQSVGGDVVFNDDVTMLGNQTIKGIQTIEKDQTIKGEQEVKGLQTLHKGFITPNFNDAGGKITGAHLTSEGIFTAAGLVADSFVIKEFIYNVIRAQGGEYMFSPSVTIKSCIYNLRDGRNLTPDDYYAEYTAEDFANIKDVTLILREDESTIKGNPLRHSDIIYGYVNKVGESGQYSVGGECIMHITGIEELVVTAELYQVGDRGVVANIPPADGMTMAQRGTEDAARTDRMSAFYLSALDGSLIMLEKVQGPTLSDKNFGASFGRLPKTLYDKIKEEFTFLNEKDPVVYAKYGIFQNLLQYDHAGQPIQRENNRGNWSKAVAESESKDENGEYISRYKHLVSYYDSVTYDGQLYKCMRSDTTQVPGEGSDWLLLVAKGERGNDGIQGKTPIIYSIEPSVTGIHLNKEGKLNTLSLDIWVNADSDRHVRIDDQNILDELGLSVWYSIDEASERKRLIIGGQYAVEIEEGGAIIVAEDEDDSSEDNFIVTLESEDIDISKIDEKINLHLIQDADESGYGEEINKLYIPVTKDGDKGDDGDAGVTLYPAGDLRFDVEYGDDYFITDDKGRVVAQPFMYYQPDKNIKGTNYVLQKPITAEENKKDKIEDVAYWRPFTRFQYLLADFLVAKWAKFGGEYGAIFYERFFFSQYGVNKDGQYVSYKGYQDSMWNEDGSLSGEFTPSLAIDMYTGATKSDKFAETFQEYRYYDSDSDELFANEISFYETYCVKFTPRLYLNYDQNTLHASPRLLTMPQAVDITYGDTMLVKAQHDTEVDGVRSVILCKANRGWTRKKNGTIEGSITGVEPFNDISSLSAASLLLCADPRLFNSYSWKYTDGELRNAALTIDDGMGTNYEVGRFVINGMFTDFIMIEPGQQVILRSCKSGNELYWYVENSEDFHEVPFTVKYTVNTAYDTVSGQLKNISSESNVVNVGWDNPGVVYGFYRRTFATSSIAKYYNEDMGGTGIAMNVTIDTLSNSKAFAESVWSWEDDVIGVSYEEI